MQPFIHLHVHSQYSILDGQASIPALVDKAIRDGMKGLALTDHGNMFGIKEFFNLVKKKNGATKDAIKGVQKRIEAIESGAEEVEDKEKELASLQEEKAKLEAKIFKPIFGCEMYVARRRLTDKEATPREIRTTVVNEVEGFSIRRGAVDEGGYHLVVLAKNLKGYHNLVKLVSKGWTDGFYSRPRTDKYELEKYHEGLIVCSACLGGEIPRRILTGDIQGAEEAILWFKNIFGEDYYLELQRHKATVPRANHETYPLQQVVNDRLIEFSRKHGIKLVCTNDVHFVEEENAEAHDRLICLSTGKDLDDPNRMLYTKQEWLKTQQEMNDIFSDVPEALSNTLEILDKVEFYSIDHPPLMPTFPIPENFGTEEEYQVGSRLPERIDFQRSARTIRRGTIRRNYGANHFRTSYHENDGFSGLLPHCTGFHQCSPQRTRCLGRSRTWFSRRFSCRLLFENYADRPSEIRFAIRTLP